MYTTTVINNISADFINARFDHIENEFKELKKLCQLKVPEDNITRSQAAEMLQCDISTIINWTKKGILTAKKIGGRVYYKRSQIESAMISF